MSVCIFHNYAIAAVDGEQWTTKDYLPEPTKADYARAAVLIDNMAGSFPATITEEAYRVLDSIVTAGMASNSVLYYRIRTESAALRKPVTT